MKNFITLLYVFYCLNLFGQVQPKELVQKFRTESIREKPLFTVGASQASFTNSAFPQSTSLEVNRENLNAILNDESKFLALSIPLNHQQTSNVELVEIDLGIDHIYIAPSNEKVTFEQTKFYRGIIKGKENSFVSLTVTNEGVSGFISQEDGTEYSITKNHLSQQHLIYNTANEPINENIELCGTSDEDETTTNNIISQSQTSPSKADLEKKCVGLYIEVDYDLYQDLNSSIQDTRNYILSTMNQVMTIYAFEGIKTYISDMYIWTSPSPYTANKKGDKLLQFRNYRADFNGDLAHLLSRDGTEGGGLAIINGLCQNNTRRHAYSEINTRVTQFPYYGWSTFIIAHEFGHLFGAFHTHACKWNGNNTPIDNCGTSVNGCKVDAENPMPERGGTIMSYCHQKSNGINLRFDKQVADYIRNNVANSECLTECVNDEITYCDESHIEINVLTDNYPFETTWELTDEEGNIILSNSYSEKNKLDKTKSCIPTGCYNFTIKDTYGDGICCKEGEGYYEILVNGELKALGGEFEQLEKINICAEDRSIILDPPSPVVEISNLTPRSTTISWTAPEYEFPISTYVVHLNGEIVTKTTDTSFELTNLEPSTGYSINVTAYATNGKRSKDKPQNFITPQEEFEYCKSDAGNSYYEWINFVGLGDLRNFSGNNGGYKDFTDISSKPTIFIGRESTLSITPGIKYTGSTTYVNAWIDFNHNGRFEDREQIVQSTVTSEDVVSQKFRVPDVDYIGFTNLRVQVFSPYSNFTMNDACGSFSYGEVEDYTVFMDKYMVINPYFDSAEMSDLSVNNKPVNVTISPNPVTAGITTLRLDNNIEGTFSILNIAQQPVINGSFQNGYKEINTMNLEKGIYFIQIKDNSNQVLAVKKLVIL